MTELETARHILEKLNSNGFVSYIVGGYVRDKMLGIESNDIDIATPARPKDVFKLFDKVDIKSEEYGTARVFLNGYCFEITTFRDELSYRDRRHPQVSFITDIKDDLKRRDFTINAMAQDIDGNVIDLFGGAFDLKNKLVRCVGNPVDRFNEDSLRILRAFYFTSRLGFRIEDETLIAISKNPSLILSLKSDALRLELLKIFNAKHTQIGINYLLETKVAHVLGVEKTLLRAKELKLDISLSDIIASSTIYNTLKAITPINVEKRMISLYNKYEFIDTFDSYLLYALSQDELSSLAKMLNIHKNKNFNISSLLIEKDNLLIKSRNDFALSTKEIISLCKKAPGPWLSEMLFDIERRILDGRLRNTKEDFISYIKGFEK